ncbi:MAG: competence/damage-inducible protein A [Clostridiales bacterium]|nr:competence/damage-inducible protein A [Clostridiales bacterium]
MYTCEIISVGTELLLGDILNTDEQFLSRKLASMGIAVLHRSSVGDNRERLAEEIRRALTRSDIVITSGGLGPTPDDLTKEVCCEVMDCPLVEHKDQSEKIRRYFEKKGMDMPESNLKQAMLPADCTVLENDNGTAPGGVIEKNGKCVIFLPGPPKELVPMFTDQAKPVLAKYSSGAIVSHSIRTMEIGESALAELAGDHMDSPNPTVAPYAKDGEALLRITASAESAEKAEELCRPVIDGLVKKIGKYVYGVDYDSIQQRVVELLRENNKKLAIAESCTAGYTAKRLTDIPGASAVFDCGIISYSNEVKMNLLGVSEVTLKKYGAVSSQTACEMAEGVRRLAKADLGISMTGVAGPGSDSEDKPAGLIYIAISDGTKTVWEKLNTGKTNDREYNRYVSASRALNLVRKYFEKII